MDFTYMDAEQSELYKLYHEKEFNTEYKFLEMYSDLYTYVQVISRLKTFVFTFSDTSQHLSLSFQTFVNILSFQSQTPVNIYLYHLRY